MKININKISKKVKDLVPPILIGFFLKNRRSKIYRNYLDAKKVAGDGYNSTKLANIIIKKTLLYEKSIVENNILILDKYSLGLISSILLSKREESVNVIDFGGGSGVHFKTVRDLLSNTKINWNIIETKEMVQATLESNQNRYIPLYFDNINNAFDNLKSNIDLIYANSSIQYAESPLTTLENLLDAKSRFIYICRTPLIDSKQPAIIVQQSWLSANGPGELPINVSDEIVNYPVTFESKDAFEKLIKQKYDIIGIDIEENNTFFIRSLPINTYSYLCKLKPLI